MLESSLGIGQAAQFFGVSERSVNRYVRYWNKGGRETLHITPQPGRPPKLTDAHADAIKNLIDSQPLKDVRLTVTGIFGFLKGGVRHLLLLHHSLLARQEAWIRPHRAPALSGKT